jgi:hypothetical protein
VQPRKSFAIARIVAEVKLDGEFTKTVSIFVCSLPIASSQTSSLPVIGPTVVVVAAAVVAATGVVVLGVDVAVEVAVFRPQPVTSRAHRAATVRRARGGW